jgi:hypothetical protein
MQEQDSTFLVGPNKQLTGAARGVGLVGRTRRRRGTVIAVEWLAPTGWCRKKRRRTGRATGQRCGELPGDLGEAGGAARQPPSDLVGSAWLIFG